MTQQTDTGVMTRSVTVRVRVSLAEKKQLNEVAAQAGLTLSDLIRTTSIKAKPLLRKPAPDAEVVLRVLAAFNKVGSLFNQVTRQLNRRQQDSEFEIPIRQISELLEEFHEFKNELRKIYGNVDSNGKD